MLVKRAGSEPRAELQRLAPFGDTVACGCVTVRCVQIIDWCGIPSSVTLGSWRRYQELVFLPGSTNKCIVNGSRPDFWCNGFSHFPHRRREGFWNAVSMSDLNETG